MDGSDTRTASKESRHTTGRAAPGEQQHTYTMKSKAQYQDVIARYDADQYDVEAMEFDDANGNFSPEDAEEYRHENIVQTSILNGQHRQARQQCLRYGLSYEEQARAIRCTL